MTGVVIKNVDPAPVAQCLEHQKTNSEAPEFDSHLELGIFSELFGVKNTNLLLPNYARLTNLTVIIQENKDGDKMKNTAPEKIGPQIVSTSSCAKRKEVKDH